MKRDWGYMILFLVVSFSFSAIIIYFLFLVGDIYKEPLGALIYALGAPELRVLWLIIIVMLLTLGSIIGAAYKEWSLKYYLINDPENLADGTYRIERRGYLCCKRRQTLNYLELTNRTTKVTVNVFDCLMTQDGKKLDLPHEPTHDNPVNIMIIGGKAEIFYKTPQDNKEKKQEPDSAISN